MIIRKLEFTKFVVITQPKEKTKALICFYYLTEEEEIASLTIFFCYRFKQPRLKLLKMYFLNVLLLPVYSRNKNQTFGKTSSSINADP